MVLNHRAYFAILATYLMFFPAILLEAFEMKPEDLRGEQTKAPVNVLQNRYFEKTMRPELGLVFGSVRDEAYLKILLHGFRGALFFNEWAGVEVQHLTTSISDSDDRKALNQKVVIPYDPPDPNGDNSPRRLDPEVNAVQKITDITGVFAPMYGKLNLLDLYILYFDLYLAGGISKISTDQGDLNAINIGIGERFYFSKSWSVRVDFRERIYTEKRGGKDTRKQLISLDFGLSYFIPW